MEAMCRFRPAFSFSQSRASEPPVSANDSYTRIMEKYTKWSDKSSGINPFVPFNPKLPNSFVLKVPRFLLGFALSVVRMATLIVVLVCFSVTRTILSPTPLFIFGCVGMGLSQMPLEGDTLSIPMQSRPALQHGGIGLGIAAVVMWVLPSLQRVVMRLVDSMYCRAAMWVCGVFCKEELANTRVLGLRAPGSKPPTGSPGAGVRSGHVLVANSLSWVELFYLQRRFSPVFAVPLKDGRVVACGLGGAVWYATSVPGAVEAEAQQAESLCGLVSRSAAGCLGPVVLLPEGTRSNAKAVLRFLPALTTLQEQPEAAAPTHLAAFRYVYSRFSPAHSTGSALVHLFWLCFQFTNQLRVSYVPASALPPCPSGASRSPAARSAAGSGLTTAAAWSDFLRGLLAQMLRVQTVDLSVDDHRSFLEYWDAINSGSSKGKEAAALLADKRKKH